MACASRRVDPSTGDVSRAEGSLDLYYGHIPTKPKKYRRVERPLGIPSVKFNNWFIPSSCIHVGDRERFVLTKQTFKAGGYELILKKIDLKEMADRLDNNLYQTNSNKSKRGEAHPIDQEQHRIRSIKRARRNLRYSIKNIGADVLLTLTIKESDPSDFLTIDQLKYAWEQFRRNCKKALVPINDYAAVPERHKKGNYHMHVAIKGRRHANTIRGCWRSALSKYGKSGNVDLQDKPGIRKRVGMARTERVASYMSKYLSKTFENDSFFNKKRYFVSQNELNSPTRTVLEAQTYQEALREVSDELNLISDGVPYLDDRNKLRMTGLNGRAFHFINHIDDSISGFWYSFHPDDLLEPPF